MSGPATESGGGATGEQFANEKHPANRPIESGDPMGMTGDSVVGDPELMLTILIEEYACIGMSAEDIARLFDDQFYGAPSHLKRMLGENRIRVRIDEVVQKCGTLQTSVSEQKVIT